MNTAIYLAWLLGQSRKNGVEIKRAILSHISDAASLHHSGKPADIIINCTGLGAAKLPGVMDSNVYPGRGQIVLVRNEPGGMYTKSGTDDGPDEALYIMQRAAGGGTILGGCLQHGASESQPDPNLAERIMQRAVDACPALAPKTGKVTELSVIRHVSHPLHFGGELDSNWIVGCWTASHAQGWPKGREGEDRWQVGCSPVRACRLRIPELLGQCMGDGEARERNSQGEGQAIGDV